MPLEDVDVRLSALAEAVKLGVSNHSSQYDVEATAKKFYAFLTEKKPEVGEVDAGGS